MLRLKFSLPLIIVGSIVTVVSICLAVVMKFKSFYEVLLLGIIIFLFGFKSTRRISPRSYSYIYISFFVLGLLVDLILGIGVFELWYYNYTSIIQYLLLYAWVYPAGGLTVVLLFILILDLLGFRLDKKKNNKFDFNDELLMVVVGIAGMAITVLYGLLDSINYLGLALFGLTQLGLFLILNVYAEKKKGFSLFYLLRVDKVRSIMAALVTVLVMVAIHEVPNTVAQQWVYTNIPLWPSILNVPLVVWVGWSVLFIVPMTSLLVFVSKDEFCELIKD